jgi:hypothetical protein
MKMRMTLAVLFVGAVLSGIGQAQVVEEVHFPKGSNSTLIENRVIRGERDQYYLTVTAGQRMEVNITAVERNAAFQIYRPGYRVGMDTDGILEIKGATLKGAGEFDDATVWNGILPSSGKYLIVVGGTRGNASYKLKITIH